MISLLSLYSANTNTLVHPPPHTHRDEIAIEGSSEPEIYKIQDKKEIKIIGIKFLLPMYEIQ